MYDGGYFGYRDYFMHADFSYRDYKKKEKKKKKKKDKMPYVSNVIKAESGRNRSYAGQWAADAVMSNRTSSAAPRKLILNVSDQCNLACSMCTYHPGQLEQRMTLDDWKKLVADTYSSGIVYTLFGGEPFLYEHIDELITYMGSLGVPMNVVTNGYYLRDHLKVLRENQCHIVLSIDGLREVHDQIRGRAGTFENIENALSEICRTYTDEQKGLVSVNSVLLPDNAHQARQLIDYLYGIGISCVCFQHLQFFGEKEKQGTDEIWKDYAGQPFHSLMIPRKKYDFTKEVIERLQDAVQNIQEAQRCYPDMEIYIYPELSAEELELYYSDRHGELHDKSRCLNPWASASVSADGNISLCLDACIGNYKEQNFWSAWYGEKAIRLRNMVTGHVFPVCTRCCNFYNSYLPI